MAFRSLSAVIASRINQSTREANYGVRLINSANISGNYGKVITSTDPEDENILTWGKSTWGVEKVTSLYKP
jgi:hypothetical protein